MEQAKQNTVERAAPAGALEVAIVVGSTRPGRKADAVARWVHDVAARRGDAAFEVVDVADYALPHFDESVPPLAEQYSQPHTHEWAAKIGAFDAYVFVTPEYNHSTSGALKNAIDFLFAEWNDKAAGFVSYGVDGGGCAPSSTCARSWASSWSPTCAPPSRSAVFDDFRDHADFAPNTGHQENLTAMLDEVVAWGSALKALRESRRARAAEWTS